MPHHIAQWVIIAELHCIAQTNPFRELSIVAVKGSKYLLSRPKSYKGKNGSSGICFAHLIFNYLKEQSFIILFRDTILHFNFTSGRIMRSRVPVFIPRAFLVRLFVKRINNSLGLAPI